METSKIIVALANFPPFFAFSSLLNVNVMQLLFDASSKGRAEKLGVQILEDVCFK